MPPRLNLGLALSQADLKLRDLCVLLNLLRFIATMPQDLQSRSRSEFIPDIVKLTARNSHYIGVINCSGGDVSGGGRDDDDDIWFCIVQVGLHVYS